MDLFKLFGRYGIEIARLHEAQSDAKKAYDIARRGRIAPPVLQDVQVMRGSEGILRPKSY